MSTCIAGPHAFLRPEPAFLNPALSRYTQWDFIDPRATQHNDRGGNEKTLGPVVSAMTARKQIIRHAAWTRLRRAGRPVWLNPAWTRISPCWQPLHPAPDRVRASRSRHHRRACIATWRQVDPEDRGFGFRLPRRAQQFVWHPLRGHAASPLVPHFQRQLFELVRSVPACPHCQCNGNLAFEEGLPVHTIAACLAVDPASLKLGTEGDEIEVCLMPGEDLWSVAIGTLPAGPKDVGTALAAICPSGWPANGSQAAGLSGIWRINRTRSWALLARAL